MTSDHTVFWHAGLQVAPLAQRVSRAGRNRSSFARPARRVAAHDVQPPCWTTPHNCARTSDLAH
eukprot:1282739-Prymnesium_polylepis.1